MMDGYKNRTLLTDLYLKQQKSTVYIGKMFGAEPKSINYYLRKYGIPVRSAGFAVSLTLGNSCVITEELYDFMAGELLGDGHLEQQSPYSAYFSYASKHKEYIYWIDEILSGMGIERVGKIGTYKDKDNLPTAYWYASRAYRNFLPLRKLFYPEGIKIIPDIEISPLVLRQWYIGDGSLIKQSPASRGKKKYITIATCAFNKEEILVAIEKLKDLGLSASHAPANNIIYISPKSVPDFLDYIGPCPVECYQYKWAIS